jgi:hypothetical protein
VSSPVVAWYQILQQCRFFSFHVPWLKSSLAGICLTSHSTLLPSGLQQWRLLRTHASTRGDCLLTADSVTDLLARAQDPRLLRLSQTACLWTRLLLDCRKSKGMLCYDWRSVGQSVLVSSTHLEPKTKFLLPSDCWGFVDAGHLLWREDGSVVYSYRWSSPAQSFLGPRLETIFYCLKL